MKAMHGGGSAPKFVTFSWGSTKLPKAAPLSISIQYALFHPNGDPMRAFVDLELAQAEDTSPRRTGAEPDDARARRGCGRTSSRTATRCTRSPTSPTATPRAGARSRRRTGSTIRSRCDAGSALTHPEARPVSAHLADHNVALYSILDRRHRDRRDASAKRSARSGSRATCACPTRAPSRRATSRARRARISRSTRTRSTSASRWRSSSGRADELTTTSAVQGPDRLARARTSARAASSCRCRGFDRSHVLIRSRKVADVPEPDHERHRHEGRQRGAGSAPTATPPAIPTTSCSRTTRPTGTSSGGWPSASASSSSWRTRPPTSASPAPTTRSSSSGRRRCARSARG